MPLGLVFFLIVLGLSGLSAGENEKSSSNEVLKNTAAFAFGERDISLLVPNKEEGKARAWLGLVVEELDLLANALEESTGVQITDVAPDAPAQQGGVRKGDLLTHWNEAPITTTNALKERLARLTMGEEVVLTVLRKSAPHRLKVKAVDREGYHWKEFWEPHLPNFKASDDLDALFDEHEDSLKALKRQFEALEVQAIDESEESFKPKFKAKSQS